eukprot:TRINITY_DN5336_c0_g1_i2.p1 TRINITY_DN5336_c0_g1~~TRINITY_DN5336_c0_g1_i2.p1  ORF type:complete len:475 (+),score=54.81 TRINITY_DN5336_c0_g1_i2:138-1562(+)
MPVVATVIALGQFLAWCYAQQCSSNKSYSISYAGHTAFVISNNDSSCTCAGALRSSSGISQLDTLVVNNLVIANSSVGVCSTACAAPLEAQLAVQNTRIAEQNTQIATQSTQIAAQNTQIAALNATVLAWQMQVLQLLGTGGSGSGICSGGGGLPCINLAVPTNGYAVNGITRVSDGGTVTFACNTGYLLAGSASAICVHGAWDRPLPTCIPSFTATFNYTGNIVAFTVPSSVSAQIVVNGAQGGSGSGAGAVLGGLGASVQGIFSLTAGQVLNLLVGEQPACAVQNCGGGGGSFVGLCAPGSPAGNATCFSTATPLIVAGGGGGGTRSSGSTANPGVANSTLSLGPYPGMPGYGAPQAPCGGSGGGFYSNGTADSTNGLTYPGGTGYWQGGAAAICIGSNYGLGGFGGGACADNKGGCFIGGGAGGGYSGGSGQGTSNGLAYGGASFNSGTSQVNITGVNAGHGSITITSIAA